MKIVVIGGTGRIGKKLVRALRQVPVDAVAASPSLGVDAVTGAGLSEALRGATVVIDVSNSPTLEGTAALQFFDSAGHNIIAASRVAGVQHYIVLSIVGVDRLLEQTYFQAKRRQEDLVRTSGLPFTILRSTQFFEFISAVVQEGTAREISISPAMTQPVAGADVAATLAELALADALNSTLELAGPEQFHLDYVATEIATAYEDGRWIVSDIHARYFGAELQQGLLLPGPDARIGSLRFDDWLRECLKVPPAVEDVGSE